MTETEPIYWYALYAKSNQQMKVCELLNKYDSVQAYVPTKKAKRTHARKTVEKDVPIIPTYVFFICNPDNFRLIRATPGVTQIVRKYLHTGEFVRIPDEQIKNIQELYQRVPENTTFQQGKLPFKKGMNVRITDGLLQGIEGIVERIDLSQKKSTIYLVVEELGYATVEVDVQYIEEIK